MRNGNETARGSVKRYAAVEVVTLPMLHALPTKPAESL
jgi:hypothetical protein